LCVRFSAEQEKATQIHVRIGIHSGDIVQRNGDVFGDGVNIAARLQGLAEPDTICISDIVYRDVAKKLDLGTVVSLGKPKLKNIAERFAVYALLPESPTGLQQKLQVQRLKLSRRVRPALLVLVSALLLGGLAIFRFPSFSPFRIPQSPLHNQEALPLPDKPSIVVLPFASMSEDPKQEYFSDGITEVLTSDLSRISSLFVIARNTAFTYKGKATNVQAIGKELGVRYVLEGSVQKANDQVRIVAQLIDTTTGSHLWSERFDRPFKDIFALQDEIVQKIVTTLKLQITLTEQGFIVRKRTDNLEAYDYLLRGIEPLFRYTQEANIQARQMFEKAIALDPQYAEAYVWLGRTYYLEWMFRWRMVPQSLERASTLAHQALALDDSLPQAHTLLGNVYAVTQQYDQALVESERAIALDSNNADSYNYQANALIIAGRPEEALQMVRRAMRLNPRYPPLYLYHLGWAYGPTGRHAEAVATLKEFLSRSPNASGAYLILALNYMDQWASQQNSDSLTQAEAAVQRALALNASDPLGHACLGFVYLWQKHYEQAIAEMEQSIASKFNLAHSYAWLAVALSGIGRAEEAIAMVEQALRHKPFVVDSHLNSVGVACYLAGRSEEAMAPLKQYLNRYPNILNGHLILAAIYSELGKEAESRTEVTEVLRLNPKFSLKVHKERIPIKDPAVLERHIAALRKAGLK
jgi:adenylate cyclase